MNSPQTNTARERPKPLQPNPGKNRNPVSNRAKGCKAQKKRQELINVGMRYQEAILQSKKPTHSDSDIHLHENQKC